MKRNLVIANRFCQSLSPSLVQLYICWTQSSLPPRKATTTTTTQNKSLIEPSRAAVIVKSNLIDQDVY